MAVNPANDHVFVLGDSAFAPVIRELGPPSDGSTVEGECGAGLDLFSGRLDIDVYGANRQRLRAAGPEHVYVLKCGEDPKSEADPRSQRGGGCPNGDWGANPRIAVDQSNGHVIEYANNQPGAAAREHDAAGACVAEFGTFSSDSGGYGLAVDNSCALHEPPLTEADDAHLRDTYPSNGNAYVAWDGPDNNVQPYDVTAFGPLGYPGERRPKAVTGTADGFGPGGATLNGTVDPEQLRARRLRLRIPDRGCIPANGETFAGAHRRPARRPRRRSAKAANLCRSTPTSRASTSKHPLPLPPRRQATPFGEDEGDADLLLGPPLLTAQAALPVGYDEATLRAKWTPPARRPSTASST